MSTTTTARTTITTALTEAELAKKQTRSAARKQWDAAKKDQNLFRTVWAIPYLTTLEQALEQGLLALDDNGILGPVGKTAPAAPAPAPAPAPAAPTGKTKVCVWEGCSTRFTPRSGRAKYCPTHSAEAKAKFQKRTGLGDAPAQTPAPTPAPAPAPATAPTTGERAEFRAQLLAKIAEHNRAVEAVGILLTALDSGTDVAVVRGFAGSLNI